MEGRRVVEEGKGGGEGRRGKEEEGRGGGEGKGGGGRRGKGRSGEGKEGGGDGRKREGRGGEGRRNKRWSISSNTTAQKHISKCCSPSTAPQAWPVFSVSVPAALLLPPLHCTGSGEVEGMRWEDRERGRRKEG